MGIRQKPISGAGAGVPFDGGTGQSGRERPDFPLGPGFGVRIAGLHGDAGKGRHPDQHEPKRALLGQCTYGVILSEPEDGDDLFQSLPDAGGGNLIYYGLHSFL